MEPALSAVELGIRLQDVEEEDEITPVFYPSATRIHVARQLHSACCQFHLLLRLMDATKMYKWTRLALNTLRGGLPPRATLEGLSRTTLTTARTMLLGEP